MVCSIQIAARTSVDNRFLTPSASGKVISQRRIMDEFMRIERVAALFDLWLDGKIFPFPKMKVKVLERPEQDFLAVSNLHRRDRGTGVPEYLSGLGNSIESSVEDLLKYYMADAKEHLPSSGYVEDDFEWSAPEDF